MEDTAFKNLDGMSSTKGWLLNLKGANLKVVKVEVKGRLDRKSTVLTRVRLGHSRGAGTGPQFSDSCSKCTLLRLPISTLPVLPGTKAFVSISGNSQTMLLHLHLILAGGQLQKKMCLPLWGGNRFPCAPRKAVRNIYSFLL